MATSAGPFDFELRLTKEKGTILRLSGYEDDYEELLARAAAENPALKLQTSAHKGSATVRWDNEAARAEEVVACLTYAAEWIIQQKREFSAAASRAKLGTEKHKTEVKPLSSQARFELQGEVVPPSKTIRILPAIAGRIIGRGGSVVTKLEAEYSCKIDIFGDRLRVTCRTKEMLELALVGLKTFIQSAESNSFVEPAFSATFSVPPTKTRIVPYDPFSLLDGPRLAYVDNGDGEVFEREIKPFPFRRICGVGGEVKHLVQDSHNVRITFDLAKHLATVGGATEASVTGAMLDLELLQFSRTFTADELRSGDAVCRRQLEFAELAGLEKVPIAPRRATVTYETHLRDACDRMAERGLEEHCHFALNWKEQCITFAGPTEESIDAMVEPLKAAMSIWHPSAGAADTD